MNTNENEYSQLRWRCHRGMLELDIILQRFLDEEYAKLSTQQQTDFVNLLECQDTELYAWLLGHETPMDQTFLALIRVIQAHVAQSN